MKTDPEALAASLRRLAQRASVIDLVPTLREVTEACVDIFGVSGSGIMIADEQNVPHYVAASDGAAQILEAAESNTGQGPCTEAFVTNEVITSSDLRVDSRWPELALAVAGHQVRAVVGLPVRLGAAPVGTLDVYLDRPHEWDDSERAALKRYADVVQATLATALAAHTAGELADQLQYALDYRVTIERGIGYLMAREQIDPVMAFNRLRQVARNTRTKIGTVAQELLTTGRLPGEKQER